jgi:hypothetical protein
MANTRDRITDTAENVRPYVERAVKDEEVRENVKNAFAAARNIYDELIGARGVTYAATRLATDKDLQGRDTHTGRNVILLVTGIALGLLFNPVTGPSTRRWLSDLVLGKDEFGDTSPANTNNNPATSDASQP